MEQSLGDWPIGEDQRRQFLKTTAGPATVSSTLAKNTSPLAMSMARPRPMGARDPSSLRPLTQHVLIMMSMCCLSFLSINSNVCNKCSVSF